MSLESTIYSLYRIFYCGFCMSSHKLSRLTNFLKHSFFVIQFPHLKVLL
ncbi:hypothetical protein LEP1GSC186_0198 [Leptospira noguchii serovar Autumnalis str. ZUN142]|uniref:Uncharacterized protein n=1 Tax=Leptospira noguchii serovar Autumnalis str. ZUN142 TaxID=1085540 RepID=M6U319_9LEPT|nr:hypothetical protein LEP1GSC186_0198 [Leptospira noguchii serovar Autumnalis str. ZUN142]